MVEIITTHMEDKKRPMLTGPTLLQKQFFGISLCSKEFLRSVAHCDYGLELEFDVGGVE